MVNQSTGEIICTAHGKKTEHDRIFKNTKVRWRTDIKLLKDKGYQGIQKLHALSQTPKKKPRKNDLSSLEKKPNRQLARIRVIGENVDCQPMVFKILSSRYTNRQSALV